LDTALKFLTERLRTVRRYLKDRSIFSKILSGYLILALSLAIMIVLTSYFIMRHSLVEQNKAEFEAIRDRIVAELNGTATPDMIVTTLERVKADSTTSEKR
jgi:uncharacterized membrane protein